MIAQQYVDRISVRFKRSPDFVHCFSSAESILRTTAVAMLFLVVMVGCVRAVSSFMKPEDTRVKVTVRNGDTLWQYAKQYGDKDRYILKKVDDIARLNKLQGSTAIQPGMEIVIPK